MEALVGQTEEFLLSLKPWKEKKHFPSLVTQLFFNMNLAATKTCFFSETSPTPLDIRSDTRSDTAHLGHKVFLQLHRAHLVETLMKMAINFQELRWRKWFPKTKKKTMDFESGRYGLRPYGPLHQVLILDRMKHALTQFAIVSYIFDMFHYVSLICDVLTCAFPFFSCHKCFSFEVRLQPQIGHLVGCLLSAWLEKTEMQSVGNDCEYWMVLSGTYHPGFF